MKILSRIIISLTVILVGASLVQAQEISSGETVYVPVYSNVFSGPRSRELELTATLSVRNTDLKQPITILKVDYFNSEGKFIRSHIDKAFPIGPLSSVHFIVAELDSSGGSGAKFIVKWKAEKDVNAPIIQAIMVTARSGLGVSFITQGRAIKE